MTKSERNPNEGKRLQKPHLSPIRTVRSPSPRPSPSGRGSIIGSVFENPSRLEVLQTDPWFSLSLRERAGVRGNGPWKVKIAAVLQSAQQIRSIPGTRLLGSAFALSAFFRPSTFGLRIS